MIAVKAPSSHNPKLWRIRRVDVPTIAVGVDAVEFVAVDFMLSAYYAVRRAADEQ